MAGKSGSTVVFVSSTSRLKFVGDRAAKLDEAINQLNAEKKRVINIIDGPIQPFGPLGNVYSNITILWEKEEIVETPATPTAVSPQSQNDNKINTVTSSIHVDASNIPALLTRIELFIEDEEWQKAIDYCAACLDYAPEEYKLYLYKCMAENHFKEIGALSKAYKLSENKDFAKAVRFAPEEAKEELNTILLDYQKFSAICRWFSDNNVKIIAACSDCTAYILPDGRITLKGAYKYKEEISNWTDIISISMKYNFAVGLRTDGTVVAVGENEYGECNTSSWDGIVSIATGAAITVGLRYDGTVVATGRLNNNHYDVFSWRNIKKIYAGADRIFGIDQGDRLHFAGTGFDISQFNSQNIISVCAIDSYTYVVFDDGSTKAVITKFGAQWVEDFKVGPNAHNEYYNPGLYRTIQKLANTSVWDRTIFVAGFSSHAIGLTDEGTCIGIGDDECKQSSGVSRWNSIVSVCTGRAHSIGLKDDGTIVAAGSNSELVIDLSSMTTSEKPGGQCETEGIKLFDDVESFIEKYNGILQNIASKPLTPITPPSIPKNEELNVAKQTSLQNDGTVSNTSNQTVSQKSGCYVATAVYGSYDCPQVWTLRRYRDYYLAKTWCGRAFIHAYYAISPIVVKWLGGTNWFKSLCKPKLDYMVEKLNGEGVASTPYTDREW